jgi:hypothetical protein
MMRVQEKGSIPHGAPPGTSARSAKGKTVGLHFSDLAMVFFRIF